MELPSKSPPLSTKTDGRGVSTLEELHRVLLNLFSEGGGGRAQALRDALCGQGDVDAILAEFNRAEGAPRPFKLDRTQQDALRALLTEPQYAPLSPAEPLAVSRVASRFWRELLSRNPGEVRDFHHQVVDFGADPNDPEKLEKVMAILRKYAPDEQWTRAHVDALVAVNAEGIRFKSLAWFPYPGDIW